MIQEIIHDYPFIARAINRRDTYARFSRRVPCREEAALEKRASPLRTCKCKRTPRKRPAMPTDFSKRLPGLEAREGRRGITSESREPRSVSPEKARQHEDSQRGGGSECGRPDARLGRQSPGSSPEPEDNSSTSGDEGSQRTIAREFRRLEVSAASAEFFRKAARVPRALTFAFVCCAFREIVK
jgi:hypothetical protein